MIWPLQAQRAVADGHEICVRECCFTHPPSILSVFFFDGEVGCRFVVESLSLLSGRS
jgi:hypothetical protein